jgi:hypothetical protein
LVWKQAEINDRDFVSIGQEIFTFHAFCRSICIYQEKSMRRIWTAIAAIVCTIFSTNMSSAQSTLGDPTPILGDQGRAIAANAALGGATMQRNNTNLEEFARREQHKSEIKACRENYRANTRSGSPQRKAAREACEKTFKAQRATWYAKK